MDGVHDPTMGHRHSGGISATRVGYPYLLLLFRNPKEMPLLQGRWRFVSS